MTTIRKETSMRRDQIYHIEHKVWYTVDEWTFDLHYHGQVNPLNLYPSSLGPLLWCGLLISESSSIML